MRTYSKLVPAIIVAASATILSTAASSQQISSQRFQFGAVGDTGYSKRSEAEFARMIEAMNAQQLAFVVHVGDFEADPRAFLASPEQVSKPCTDEHFGHILAQFQQSAHPFVLTPGDNDWSDCYLLTPEIIDPLERLARLREVFYPEGHALGGRTMPVQSQSMQPEFAEFRENQFWIFNNVAFMTIHTVGGNDNRGRTTEMDAEATERTNANVAWLRRAFAEAKANNVTGLVLITQANLGFETRWTRSLINRYFRVLPAVQVPEVVPPTGYDMLLDAIAEEMEGFDRPTLFIHGDTHMFRVNMPLVRPETGRFVDNFIRLEVFGDPDTHWVRVTVDPNSPELFVVEPQIVPVNRATDG